MRDQGRRERTPKPFTAERAWNYLLFLLSRRAYTVAELRARLLRRGLPENEAEPLLTRLQELKLVDDAAYAEQYVRSRTQARGRLVLRRELTRKGVGEELVELEMAGLSPAQQADAATELLLKNAWRYHPAPLDTDAASVLSNEQAYERRQQLFKARGKAFGFLARRGFGSDAAAQALERVGWFGDDE